MWNSKPFDCGGLRGAAVAAASAVAIMLSAAATAKEPARGELTVEADGFETSYGQAVAKLFLPGENVRGRGHWETTASINEGRAALRFGGLGDGKYAVIVFHDLNSNGVVDHGALGPSEPLGFSGGYTLSLRNGLPTFEKLQFDFRGPAQTLRVTVR